MRVGDRSVTKYVNEADGERADRPRLFFQAAMMRSHRRSFRGGSVKTSFRIWIACVPVLALILTAFVIQRTENLEPPPVLQAFVQPPSTPAAPLVSPQRPKANQPYVRVNVTPGGVDSFQLDVRGRYELISLESKKNVSHDRFDGTVTVTSTKSGLKIGSRNFKTTQLEIIPEQSPSIRVNDHLYRGTMRLFRRTDGKVSAVNVLPIEEYLASVVDSEMPASFPEAARQAQAIVARTYALYQIEKADPVAVYDLLASQRSQKYLGVEYLNRNGRRLAGESESSRRVIASTRGMVCKRNDKLFCTYYSAVCGGQTTDGQLVFKDADDAVRSVPCEWCRASPHYRWTTEVSHDDFHRRILARGSNERKTVAIQSIQQESGPGDGRVSKFKIDDGEKSHSVSGIELRERMPGGTLSSPHFSMKLEKDRVIFEGRGHGHGVGFCQWGAKGQAEEGHNSLDIVRYYFPGSDIAVLDY